MMLREMLEELSKKDVADVYVVAATCLELVAQKHNGKLLEDEFKGMTVDEFSALIEQYGGNEIHFTQEQLKHMYDTISKFTVSELEALLRQNKSGEAYPHREVIKKQFIDRINQGDKPC